jgi:Na+-driven multidrug efflux pump
MAIDGSAAVQAVIMVFSGGLSVALSSVSGIRTAYYLGAGDSVAARRTAWLTLVSGIVATSVIAVFLLPLGHVVMSVVTNDGEIQDLGAALLPASLLNTMASTLVQTGTSGIITSQGRAKLVTFLSMGFELPLSLGSTAFVVLVYHSPITVVYWIQAIVSCFEAVVVCLLVHASDWPKLAREAKQRQGGEEETNEDLGTSMIKGNLEDKDDALVPAGQGA